MKEEANLIEVRNGHYGCPRCGLNISVRHSEHECKTREERRKEIWDKGIKEHNLELLNEMIWNDAFDEMKENIEFSKTKGMGYNNLSQPFKSFYFVKIGEMQEAHRKLQELIKNWKTDNSNEKVE